VLFGFRQFIIIIIIIIIITVLYVLVHFLSF